MKKALWLILAVLAAGGILAAVLYKPLPTTMKERFEQVYPNWRGAGVNADYVQFDLEGLMRTADTVALVTPVDKLSFENSYNIYEDSNWYGTAYSVREVKAIEYYKNENNYGDTFEMAEKCAMLSNGTLVRESDCYPMQKGDYYLVFIADTTTYTKGYSVPISADNGKIDLTYLSLNRRDFLVGQALLGLDLIEAPADFTEEQSEKFINAEFYSAVSFDKRDSMFAVNESQTAKLTSKWKTLTLTTPYTKKGMELELEYTITDYGKLFIREKGAELS